MEFITRILNVCRNTDPGEVKDGRPPEDKGDHSSKAKPSHAPKDKDISPPGVTFKVADKPIEGFNWNHVKKITAREHVLKYVWGSTTSWRCTKLLRSSMSTGEEELGNFIPKANGFIDAVLQAYRTHHRLVIRPDDIWITILSQINLFVNAHAEELRHIFVEHEGQKELKLVYGGERHTFDFSIMARDFGLALKENIKDPLFYDFVIPNFSTTTYDDTIVCSGIMMSILKEYFTYYCVLTCGIPEVTLLGTKADYENILTRLDSLLDPKQLNLGAEPRAFARLLSIIIREFIKAFDGPDNISVDFWNRICTIEAVGSGSDTLTGWITAFCVWDKDGRWKGPAPSTAAFSDTADHTEPETKAPLKITTGKYGESLTIGGLEYAAVDIDKIPPAYAEADVKLNDNGELFDCTFMAGHVGFQVSQDKDTGGAIITPSPHWYMFEKRKK